MRWERGDVMNYGKLRGAMAEKGVSQAELAQLIGISLNSLNRKLNGRTDFTVKEASEIASALDIEDPVTCFFG